MPSYNIETAWKIVSTKADGEIVRHEKLPSSTFCREIAYSEAVSKYRADLINILVTRIRSNIATYNDCINNTDIYALSALMYPGPVQMETEVYLLNPAMSLFDSARSIIADFPSVQIEEAERTISGFTTTTHKGFKLSGDEYVGPAFFWVTAQYRDGFVSSDYRTYVDMAKNYPWYPRYMMANALGPMHTHSRLFLMDHVETMLREAQHNLSRWGIV